MSFYALSKHRFIRLAYQVLTKPPSGKRWIVIGGATEHVTGTKSVVTVRTTAADRAIGYINDIHEDMDTGNFPMGILIHKEGTTYLMSAIPLPIVIDDSEGAYHTGDASSYSDIEVFEVPKP